MDNKVIISCAVTGSIHTPTMSPHLPFAPEDIARHAIEAAEAGAAILHFHARDPETGKPNADPAVYMQFLPTIKAATNAIINITTGGGLTMNLDQRLAPALRIKPELASFNMGSMNFSIHRAARRHHEWKYDWEEPYLKATEGNIFRNTFVDMKRVLKDLGEGCGTRFEYECYDLGHFYNLAYLLDEKLVEPPFFLQSVFGILGGMGTEVELLSYVRATADRLFGRENYEWSVIGPGRHQMRIGTLAAILGGSVRVGLEDSLWLRKGELAKSSADQVRKIRGILEALSFEIASPDEVRKRLRLKGADKIAV
ncbi:MAG TPA: 3-keto-5-aminohexanoate cleavage protein [Acidobacteriaceae bacterium]|nr:3-keto-5-aminohexanoate cleavage protein [Acidobacteriaceae bacterium]